MAAALAVVSALVLAEAVNRWFELPLRRASTATAAAMMRAAGIGVERHETSLITTRGRFDVLLPCSGGRFLGATLALGLASLVIGRADRWRKAILAALLVPLAVAGNAARVVGLVVLADRAGPGLHTALGCWCFALVAAFVAVVADLRPPSGDGAGPPGQEPPAP